MTSKQSQLIQIQIYSVDWTDVYDTTTLNIEQNQLAIKVLGDN